MANIAFPDLSTTSRLPNGTTYAYVHVKPESNKPYILFLHGFPDTSYVWKRQIEYFSKKGYGLVVPDLLGYGGTDKPKEPEAYRLKKMSDEVVGILDHHEIKEVIGVGHDWGSFLLSRLANYHPTRLTKFAWIDVAYQAPTGQKFSVEAINEMTTKALGYPIFGYWLFFNDADAGKVMDDHHAGMRAIKFASDSTFMKDNMCYLGACRSYFEEKKTCPIGDWATNEEMDTYDKIMKEGGYGAPLNWYKCQMANFNSADEVNLSDEEKQIKQPALLLTCARDPICVPAIQEQGMRPFVKDITIKQVDSGHWGQQEKADEVNQILEAFVEGSS